VNTIPNRLLPVSAVLAAVVLLTEPSAPGASPQAPVTLVHPDSATKAPGPEGFLQRWSILEPIRAGGVTQSAVQAAVKKSYFPDQFTILPHDGDKVKVSGEELAWHAVDTKDYNVNLYHFAYGLNKPTSGVLFWAVTVVNCPEEMAGIRLSIGSNDASVWWVNGQEVIGIYGDRQTVIDDGVSRKLTLKKGPNVIRCAIHNQGGATDFCARFLDQAGNPLKGITLSLTENGR
jgi:hypothetical protein